ncbi:MAG: hypothetical protein NVS4B3_20870 [Gemmatimonadaceae bacterium]
MQIRAAQHFVAITGTAAMVACAATAPQRALVPFIQLSAGGFDTCALTAAGSAYCWRNQVGVQTSDSVSQGTPLPVSGGLSFQRVSAGGYHNSCALTLLGVAYCWGENAYGQLGNGTTTTTSSPVAVSGGLTFQSLSAGQNHVCALTPAGVAYCWGHNGSSQLGTTVASSLCPAGGGGNPAVPCNTTPVPVAGGLTFTMISAGNGQSCALTAGGSAYCWGGGYIGDGSSKGSSTPTPVSGGLVFRSLSVGAGHTCALTVSGTPYCWGFTGVVNTARTAELVDSVPALVPGDLALQSISTGGGFACGLTGAGAVYCWGNNSFGQLGSTSPSSLTPVSLLIGQTFPSLSAGGSHACVLTRDGAARCWGAYLS